MSTRYRIELYFPIQHIEAAVTELRRFMYEKGTQPYELRLPDGKTITVLSSPSFPPHSVHRPDVDWVSFDTILLIPVDETIQAYLDAYDDPDLPKAKDRLVFRDGETLFPFGYLGVSVVWGKRYAQLSVGVVSGSQNSVLRYSPAFHRTMISLLNRAGGLFGLINVESYECIVLTDTTRTVYVDREPLGDGMDIDAIAEETLALLNKPV